MDKEIDKIKEQIDSHRAANRELMAAIKQATGVASVKELKEKVDALESETDHMKDKIDMYFGDEHLLVEKDVMEAAVLKREKIEKKGKSLRRECLEIVDTLAEGQDKSRKEFMVSARVTVEKTRPHRMKRSFRLMSLIERSPS